MEPQLLDELEVSEETQELVIVVVPPAAPTQPRVFTLEKFVNNGTQYFKGTTPPDKVEAWSLNMLKNFRVMEVPENHWVRLASYMFEEETTFWREAAQKSTFVELLHGMNS